MKSGPAYYWDVNKDSAPVLKAIRRASRGNGEEAARLTRENFNGKASYETQGEKDFRFGSFTTMGELHIATGLDEAKIRDYERTLSVDSAFATVNFTAADGTRYTRRAFISYPDNVLVVRFTADRRGQQNLTLSYAPNPCAEGKMVPEGKEGLVYRAQLDNNGMRYVVRLRAVAKGGTVTNTDGRFTVKGADEVTFLLTADTDYRMNLDPRFDDPKAYVGVDPRTHHGEMDESGGATQLLLPLCASLQGLRRALQPREFATRRHARLAAQPPHGSPTRGLPQRRTGS